MSAVPFATRQKWQQHKVTLLEVLLCLLGDMPMAEHRGCLLACAPELLIIHSVSKMFPQGDN